MVTDTPALYSTRRTLRENLPEKTSETPTPSDLTLFLPCSGPRGLPSPPGEGDRDRKWSDLGSVARFCLLSSSLLLFLFCLLLAPGSEVSEPPPPPLYSPSFCFTSFPSDRVLSARLSLSSGHRDLLRPWMFGGHRVWGLLPVRDSLDYLIFGGLLGWDQGSKPSAVLDIGCCGCSYNLLDCGQDLCRLVLL
uniref:Uncharacterized protein n=1 Tax=Fagus sylvatica TaxID=28930 RepID=A0A2N9G3F3_FAGSY